MIASVCLFACQNFDICCSLGRSRMLYYPAPETTTADCHLVLSVDLDSINADGLARYSPL